MWVYVVEINVQGVWVRASRQFESENDAQDWALDLAQAPERRIVKEFT